MNSFNKNSMFNIENEFSLLNTSDDNAYYNVALSFRFRPQKLIMFSYVRDTL